MEIPDLILRPSTPDDFNFIMNSWLMSTRKLPEFKFVTNEVYFKEHAKVITKLISKGCVILCKADDPSQIYGYLCYQPEEKLAHFVYIKYPFRKFGFAKKFLSLVTPDFVVTYPAKNGKYIYNPFKRYAN